MMNVWLLSVVLSALVRRLVSSNRVVSVPLTPTVPSGIAPRAPDPPVELQCPVCRHTQFFAREYLLNTRLATFFNVDWTNRAASAYICERYRPS